MNPETAKGASLGDLAKQLYGGRGREVTKLLADLDVYFSYGKNDSGEPVWSLAPFEAEGIPQGISVQLWLTDLWLFVFHQRELKRQPDKETLVRLLRLNTVFSGAKIGFLVPKPGAPDQLAIAAELSATRLSLEHLREAIAAVVGVSREVWKTVPD
jgi:hypothetical protein